MSIQDKVSLILTVSFLLFGFYFLYKELVRRKGLEPLSKPEQDILNYKYKETKKILNKSFNEFEHLINGSL